mgnify:CR=1 FL=1
MKTLDELKNTVILGDCLEKMADIPDKSIDLILCDLPYGTTVCKWDVIIPFSKLWAQYQRIIKDNSGIVLFGNEPFSSYLRISNISWYKYDWIWDKVKASGHLNSKFMPMQKHENISVFGNGKIKYFPQGTTLGNFKNQRPAHGKDYKTTYGIQRDDFNDAKVGNYPKTIITFNKPNDKQRLHPTQKPINLCEYLIKTYTNENDFILDNCAGSGTTGLAARNLNRNYILIEKNETYYNIILERLKIS